MANTKSSKKDLRRSAKKTIRNKAVRSALKTYIKKVRTTVTQENPEQASVALIDAVSALDKAVQRGIIHKNQAARRKSRIAKKAAALLKAGPVAPKEKVEAKATPAKKAAEKPAEKAPAKAAAKPAKEATAKAPAAKKPAAKKAKSE